ncbi:MAG: phosphoribosyltransferase family protein [Pirellulales bacterium]
MPLSEVPTSDLWRRWAAQAFDLLWPPRCVFCGAEPPHAAGEEQRRRAEVCETCGRTLASGGGRCGRCGQPGDDDPCGRCGSRLGDCAGIVVLGSYADAIRDAVLRAKRPTGDLLAAGLAALLVERHGDRLRNWHPDLVVPVPMHWTRRLARGTSAADELARGVAAGLGLPLRRAIRRSRRTVMQNSLPRGNRRGNVAGAFRAGRGVAGRRVLVVDDVTTTGATLAACSAALLSAGATTVYAAVVACADTTDVP